MSERSIRTALISTDRGFREVVRDVFLSHEGWAAPALEITAPFESLGEEQIRALRQLLPELLIIDIDDSPELGIRFAQFLSETTPGIRFIAAGPLLQPELLLTAMRAGVADYLPKPVTAEALRDALDRIRAGVGTGKKDDARRVGQIYAFYSPKGGAGTTTTATNFAVVLHRLTGKKTLLVDLDLELGEIALLLGVQPRFNFVDMVQNFHRMDAELLASYIERHESGVHLLSAPYQPEKAEVGDRRRRSGASCSSSASTTTTSWWIPRSRSRRRRWPRSSRPTSSSSSPTWTWRRSGTSSGASRCSSGCWAGARSRSGWS